MSGNVSIDNGLAAFVPRRWITLDEVVSILSGDDSEHRHAWWNTWIEAIESGVIASKPWGAVRAEQQILHEDVRLWCEAHNIVWPVPQPSAYATPAGSGTDDELSERGSLLEQISGLKGEVERLQRALDAVQEGKQEHSIRGDTFAKLASVIEAFPSAYPNYRKQPPKLDGDLRPWVLKRIGLGRQYSFVFGTIISEHFDFDRN